MLLSVKKFFQKNWKYIAAGVVALGALLAWSFRTILGGGSDPLKAISKKVEKRTEADRKAVKDDLEKESNYRAELEADRNEAAADRDKALKSIDDARNLDDLDDLAGRPN